jgi:hypothetical protein
VATELQKRDAALERIYGVVDRGRLTWRLLDAARGLLRTVLVAGGAVLAGFAADNLLHLPSAVRLVWGLALLCGLLFMAARLVVYPLVRRMTDAMVAAHLERTSPGLDNRVINAVLLADERFRDPLTRRMAGAQIRETALSMGGPELKPAGAAALGRPARRAAVVAVVLLAYALAFSDHFTNAALRFLYPTRYIPPLTNTRLHVSPGDAELLQGDPLAVEARVAGLLPETAVISVETSAGERASASMSFEGNAFTYRFANVQSALSYRIGAGDALTRPYRVRVRERPAIQRLRLRYAYPAYTALPEREEADAPGDVSGPVGTVVRVTALTDRPVQRGWIEVRPEDGGEAAQPARSPLVPEGPQGLGGEFRIAWSGTYKVYVEDAAGVGNAPRVHRLEAIPDAPPRVVFEQPAADVAVAPDARVTLLAGAEDDFSLRELHLLVQRRAGAEWERLQGWTYGPGTRACREGAVLDVAGLGLKAGEVLAYYMQANDGLRREDAEAGRSRVYHVRLVDQPAAARAAEQARESLRDAIRKLIEMQQQNLDATRALADRAAGESALDTPDDAAWTDLRASAGRLTKAQEEVYKGAVAAAAAYAGEATTTMTEGLVRIAAGEVTQAVALLKQLEAAPDRAAVQVRSGAAADSEAAALAMLRQLLDNPAALLAQLLEREGKAESLGERAEDLLPAKQLAEKLVKSLERFAEEQKKTIEMSNRLSEKPVDDFTNQDEQDLQKIAQTEKEWSKFFQEAATDLSKLPPQDMSLATQAKEFLEVYSEMQQAAEEAERKAVELAVPHEQAGLELAQSIETNIEKWLMETKDNQVWSMEEPLEDYEVPLAELPEELQDLIGDLVEGEEDMQEEFDDVTSGWFDSLDIGAGWDTTDGPISNMSAKGVTGNRLPNTQEIGGRSGEGRTGKSSGQFVEEEATGKGGRQTPSRLTADPFEAGWVKDSSAEAPTGATGGGKVSGQGAEGFQGPVPPPLQQALKRLAAQQSELIDKAKRLDYGLKKYRYPQGHLPESIELMQAQQQSLDAGEIGLFGSRQRVLLSNLREVKELSETQKQLFRDRSALLPKQLREEIASGRDEPVPEQYRTMVEDYFRSLSELGKAQ